ncbi:helix-turn-helix transcriptional regulator [Clostridium sp. ASF356]|nr:helix-turn-helix transcriptional regulator [Clostridium sp. MD294]
MYTTDCIALRTKMAMKGINTIKDLSEKSGVGCDTLSKILNGKIKPSTKIIERLIDVLEITPDEAGSIFFNCDLHIA